MDGMEGWRVWRKEGRTGSGDQILPVRSQSVLFWPWLQEEVTTAKRLKKLFLEGSEGSALSSVGLKTQWKGGKNGRWPKMRGSKCVCACMLVCVQRLKAFQVILTLGGLWKTPSIINHQSSITCEVWRRGSDSLDRNKRNGSMRTLPSKCF